MGSDPGLSARKVDLLIADFQRLIGKFSNPVIPGDPRRAHNRACRPEGQVQGGGGAVAGRPGGPEEEQKEIIPWDGQADGNVHQPASE